jgi:hypothetical protein
LICRHNLFVGVSSYPTYPTAKIIVAEPGCLSRIRLFSIPDPTFFHPGYRIRIVPIPDSASASEKCENSNPKKWFLSSKKYDPGYSSRIRILTFYPSRIRILTFYPSRIPDPGVKKAPDPGSATLAKIMYTVTGVLLPVDPAHLHGRLQQEPHPQEPEQSLLLPGCEVRRGAQALSLHPQEQEAGRKNLYLICLRS